MKVFGIVMAILILLSIVPLAGAYNSTYKKPVIKIPEPKPTSSSHGDSCLTLISDITGKKMDIMAKPRILDKTNSKFSEVSKKYKRRIIISEDDRYIRYAYIIDGSICVGYNPETKKFIKEVPHTPTIEDDRVLSFDWLKQSRSQTSISTKNL